VRTQARQTPVRGGALTGPATPAEPAWYVFVSGTAPAREFQAWIWRSDRAAALRISIDQQTGFGPPGPPACRALADAESTSSMTGKW
jgi:hypothetical protein